MKENVVSTKEIIDAVQDLLGHSPELLREIVEALFYEITEQITDGKEVRIKDFGRFSIKSDLHSDFNIQNVVNIKPRGYLKDLLN